MTKDSIALKIDGKVSLADFRTVVDAFSELIQTLTQETNPDVTIEWTITDLEGGSATIVSRGFFGGNLEAETAVAAVVEKYQNLGRDAEAGSIDGYSVFVQERMQRITSVVNGRIPRILRGTGKTDWSAAVSHRITEETPILMEVETPAPSRYSAFCSIFCSRDNCYGR